MTPGKYCAGPQAHGRKRYGGRRPAGGHRRRIDSMLATPGGIHSIGICAPGRSIRRAGVVLNPPNLPCWRNFPLAERISAKYQVPVKVTTTQTPPPWRKRVGGRRADSTTFSTPRLEPGLEPALCSTERIYHGNTGSAGEGGHMSIDYHGPVCSCGKRGCIEVLAAGPAIGARARAKLAAEPFRGPLFSTWPTAT